MSTGKTYSQKSFEKDLKELEKLIEKGGMKNKKTNQNNENQNNENQNNENQNNENQNNEQDGGDDDDKYRHFKLVEVNGKSVDYGKANIKEKRSPLSAARKLLGSIALKQGLSGNDKLKLRTTTFSIQETTRGSKKHGKITTYIGKYRKYTPEEMKKAHAAGQSFHMKPEVHLYKEKVHKDYKSPRSPLKGGLPKPHPPKH